ncbi:uncharacterized protein HaLaN_03362 [Haematococcus lacustris]|uniref:Glycoside hydrolase family 31 TIM barrel domain-containing protein n=1 Tax=Haematococcus lacustris TaxID=44745 RepID=A0A699YQH0_HAELA|nr:uncharacterized protein HaLaN_03362 [Haematococcus lacustris]
MTPSPTLGIRAVHSPLDRWLAAGAFYTFARNHNTLGATPQEAYVWPAAAAAARSALGLRLALLPYLYTAHHTAHTRGGSVARPVWSLQPDDPQAHDAQLQTMDFFCTGTRHNVLRQPAVSLNP